MAHKKLVWRRHTLLSTIYLFLIAVLLVGCLTHRNSWTEPSVDMALETSNNIFRWDRDSLWTDSELTIWFSGHFYFKETSEEECKGTVMLRTVMGRLITIAVERAKEYYPPYTKTEIEDYLRANSNILVVQFEIFREEQRELEWSSILIVQGETVIRPIQYDMHPIATRDLKSVLLSSRSCQGLRYILEGAVAFNTSDLDANAPFQIKIIEGGRDTSIFDIDPPDQPLSVGKPS